MRRNRAAVMGWTLGRTWALAACVAIAAAGCGEPTPKIGTLYPVKGKITQPDGKPLENVKVIFAGPVSSVMVTGSDGAFASGGENNPGLPAGDYKIRLEIVEVKGSPKRPIRQFPDKYLDEGASKLTATVKPDGPNDFDFKLTKDEAQSQGPGRRGKVSD